MKLFKVKYDVEQGGKKFPFQKTDISENNPPKVGSSRALMTTPPIYETVVSVEDITPDRDTVISLSATVLEIVEKTRKKFFGVYGKDPENNRKLFIEWYIKTHEGSYDFLINDLSEFYLHISEDRIRRLLNE